VRLFIEQHGESRFDPLGDPDARSVNNRAGWRKGSGPDREWLVPPEVWKSEICNGLDPTMVAKVLAERCKSAKIQRLLGAWMWRLGVCGRA
jgi:putative DNA primase/helicase